MTNNKLSLYFMKTNPFDAILIKESNSDMIALNNAFKKMFNTSDSENLKDILPLITMNENEQNIFKEKISSKDITLSEKPFEIYKNKQHYRFYFFYDSKEEIHIVHARDLAELDMLSSQIKEYAQGLVKNIVGLEMSQREIEKRNLELQEELKSRQLAEELLKQSLDNQHKIINEMIKTISLIGIIKDPYTGMHQQRVANLAKTIAEDMNLHHEQIQGIYIAGMLHDIGKISIPSEILSKPGKISDVELLLIKKHPVISYEILKQIEFPWPVAKIAYQHHEKLDGSGYPDGISGDEIILESKIIGVADVVEAVSSHRPYRESLGIDAALKEIKDKSGLCYDKDVVDTCIKLFKEKNFTFDNTVNPLQ